MTLYNIFHVAINSPGTGTTELIKQVSAILGKDPFDVRMLLSGKLPKIAAHFDSEEKAKSIASSLSACGIKAFTVNDRELHRSDQPETKFVAHSLKIGNGEIIFISRSGAETIVRQGELFLVIQGKVSIPEVFKETRTSMKFSLPATIMTGGLPVWRKSKETVENTSFYYESFMRLYLHNSPGPLVEILESNFDFSFLPDQISPSASMNFDLMVKELKRVFAAAFFDNRLAECTPIIQLSEIETACKLIYLSYRA
jgi:hypothetical protein